MSNGVLFNKCSTYISAYKAISGCMQVSQSLEEHFVLQCMRSGMSMCLFHQCAACCLSLDNSLPCVLHQIHSLLSFFPPASSSYSSSSASFQANQPASTFSRSPCATWSAAALNGLWSPLWSTRCWQRQPPPWCLLPPSFPPHTPSPCPAWRSRRSQAARGRSFLVRKKSKFVWDGSNLLLM